MVELVWEPAQLQLKLEQFVASLASNKEIFPTESLLLLLLYCPPTTHIQECLS